ncbi:MAG: hypothetical protein OXC42_00595 [Gammaproteobacteria bacterium]|nr:hypothetical protein [Gammaproteobacteria bacterium]
MYSAIAMASFRKAQVQAELAHRQTALGNALIEMSEANKRFIQSGGGFENIYLLEEAYSVGMWVIGKYTGYLRERIRTSIEVPEKPLSDQRVSMQLLMLY